MNTSVKAQQNTCHTRNIHLPTICYFENTAFGMQAYSKFCMRSIWNECFCDRKSIVFYAILSTWSFNIWNADIPSAIRLIDQLCLYEKIRHTNSQTFRRNKIRKFSRKVSSRTYEIVSSPGLTPAASTQSDEGREIKSDSDQIWNKTSIYWYFWPNTCVN
jgi:hypothetical protein